MPRRPTRQWAKKEIREKSGRRYGPCSGDRVRHTPTKRNDLNSVAVPPSKDTQHDDAEHEEREDFTKFHLTSLYSCGAATGGEASVMGSPIVRADQDVLSGV